MLVAGHRCSAIVLSTRDIVIATHLRILFNVTVGVEEHLRHSAISETCSWTSFSYQLSLSSCYIYICSIAPSICIFYCSCSMSARQVKKRRCVKEATESRLLHTHHKRIQLIKSNKQTKKKERKKTRLDCVNGYLPIAPIYGWSTSVPLFVLSCCCCDSVVWINQTCLHSNCSRA